MSELERKLAEKIIKEYQQKTAELSQPEIRINHWIQCFSNNNFSFAKSLVLADLSAHKEIAVPLLIESSHSENGSIRYWSIHFLMKMADRRAETSFRDRLSGDWGATTIDAAEGLYRIGNEDESISYMVNAFLDDNSFRDLRLLAARRLIELGLKKVIPNNAKLDLQNISEYLHDTFRDLYRQLS